jgi:23S rRNA pseudouridine2605 synthase
VLYKPKGYVTTRKDPEGRRTVMDLIGDSQYIYPVGRLDYDTEGLLLMTTDGDLAARLMHPRHEVDKEYEVIVLGAPDGRALEKLKKGVYIEGGRTSPAQVHVGTTVKGHKPTTLLTITIREGRNRQIRKMCSAVGLPVRDLRRIRMGPITLGRLKPGQWRELTLAEIKRLKAV